MSGINSGILSNASPLSAEAIKELERKVLETGEAYAYLDQDSKLCFAMPNGVGGIQELAWNSAYELSSESGTLTKKAYKKTGLKTFTLDKTYTKTQVEGAWILTGVVFEFDGDFSKYPTFDLGSDEFTVTKLVRVSDRVFSMQELSSSTITGDFGGPDDTQTIAGSVLTPLESSDPDVGVTMRMLSLDLNGEYPIICVWENYMNNEALPATGTYFLYLCHNETLDHNAPMYNEVYTKSISCLTTADAIQPTERLEGDGQEFYTAAPSTLSFRSTAPLNEFQDVLINGQTVDPSNYTLEEGSTIVKLSHEYLKTLDAGSYELSVVSNSKTVKGDFTVTAPELNEYGFYYGQPYWVDVDFYAHDSYLTGAFIFLENNTIVFLEQGGYSISYGNFTQSGNSFSFNIAVYCDEFNITATGEFSADGKAFSATQFNVISNFHIGDRGCDYGPVNGVLNPASAASDEIYYYSLNYENTEFSILPKSNIETFYAASYNNINGKPVTSIGSRAFYEQMTMESIEICDTITAFGWNAFYGCTKLNNITFKGTVAQWNAIDKGGTGEGEHWNVSIPATYVQCYDGQVAL